MFEIHGQEHKTDNDSADDITHCKLKKAPVAPIGKTGHADEGQYRSFGSDNGEHGNNPGEIVTAVKIVSGIIIAFAMP